MSLTGESVALQAHSLQAGGTRQRSRDRSCKSERRGGHASNKNTPTQRERLTSFPNTPTQLHVFLLGFCPRRNNKINCLQCAYLRTSHTGPPPRVRVKVKL